jgi:transcriptional regulator with GAF, ATPase, and Fis domain
MRPPAGLSVEVQRSAALDKVRHVADTSAPVLLLGETGTGKELLARAIHAHSRRREGAFIAVNCAALPAALFESELFGYEQGAFTGAAHTKPGRFESADHGTLFLDEVAELEATLQAKLLRVAEEGEIRRRGSTASRKVDVRLVAATNRNLHQDARDGRFRPDLYYWLGVFPIEVPPLRDRREDIPLLVCHFIRSSQLGLGRTPNTSVLPEWLRFSPTTGPETSASCGTSSSGRSCSRAIQSSISGTD